jgi:hypothetical protein
MRLVKLIAARRNELDQHGAESGLAGHCQAKGPGIDELIIGESHGVVSEVNAHLALFTLLRLAPKPIQGCREIGLSVAVLNVRLRLLGIDPWISR